MRLMFLLALAMLAVALSVSAQSVNWVQYINPTDRDDIADGVCLFGEYLAVMGEADDRYFVVLLDRATGEVVKTWVGESFGWFKNCLSVGDRLYAVGRDKLYIFDGGLNVVKVVEADGRPQALAFDGDYLYLVGYSLGGRVWLEKRTLDLYLIDYMVFYREWDVPHDYHSYAYDIAVNPATGELWVVGEYDLLNRTASTGFQYYSLLVIFDRGLNVRRVVEYPRGHENYLDALLGICFDEEGNAYVVGWRGVAKFDKDGNVMAVNRGVGGLKIACVGGRVYVFGEKEVDYYDRHVLYVFDKELNLMGEYVLSMGVRGYSFFSTGKPAFDGGSLYVAGFDHYALGQSRIVVYSILPFWRVVVVDELGRPMRGAYVEAVVGSRSLVNRTGEDGVVVFVDVLPEKVYVYDEDGLLVGFADGNESQVVVRRVGEVRAANSVEARGYAVFKGQFLNGTAKSLTYEFAVSGGAMRIQRPIPSIYPVEVYVAEVSVGALRLKLEKPLLIYRGNASDLAKGLDFAELGLTSLVSITAVDSTGSPRRDWTVQLIYGNVTVAEGRGTLTAVLPRTSVLGQPYVVKVVTTALTPEGSAATREQLVAAVGVRREVRVAVPTARVTVLAVDGFGQPRDWPVEIENVARGMGSVAAELLEGAAYTARAAGLGFTNVTKFVARGPEMSVAVKIPTARLTTRVVDGFGNVRSDWPVEVAGVVSGQGSVAAEVLAGRYTVRAVAFGREFVEEVAVAPGQDAVALVQVPTARLSVYVVDEYMRPIDQYVTLVEVSGPVAQFFSEPPRDLEVLAGLYFITVTALGKRVSTAMTLHSGDNVTVRVLVPGAAGIDVGGTRITYSTLYTVLGVAVAVAVVGFAAVKLRPRGKGR